MMITKWARGYFGEIISSKINSIRKFWKEEGKFLKLFGAIVLGAVNLTGGLFIAALGGFKGDRTQDTSYDIKIFFFNFLLFSLIIIALFIAPHVLRALANMYLDYSYYSATGGKRKRGDTDEQPVEIVEKRKNGRRSIFRSEPSEEHIVGLMANSITFHQLVNELGLSEEWENIETYPIDEEVENNDKAIS